jgi:hypothetical protein
MFPQHSYFTWVRSGPRGSWRGFIFLNTDANVLHAAGDFCRLDAQAYAST